MLVLPSLPLLLHLLLVGHNISSGATAGREGNCPALFPCALLARGNCHEGRLPEAEEGVFQAALACPIRHRLVDLRGPATLPEESTSFRWPPADEGRTSGGRKEPRRMEAIPHSMLVTPQDGDGFSHSWVDERPRPNIKISIVVRHVGHFRALASLFSMSLADEVISAAPAAPARPQSSAFETLQQLSQEFRLSAEI